MGDGRGAVIVQVLVTVAVGADIASRETLFQVLEELGVDGHHVFKVAVLGTVLDHQDLAVALDDLGFDFAHLFGQTESGQRRSIGSERVGRQHVGAGVAVFRVNLPDELRFRKAQFVEAPVGEDVMPVDFGAHRSVEDEDAAV